MIQRLVGQSVRRKLMVIIGVAILFALFVNGVALLIYDVNRYSEFWLSDLQSQAEVVGRASIPAIEFDDPHAAASNLALLSIRPTILAAGLYDGDGRRFAEFHAPNVDEPVPGRAAPVSHWVSGSKINLFQPISDRGRVVGTVFIVARYQLSDRVTGYLAISGLVTLLSLIAALLLSLWFQRFFTQPIILIAEVARRIRATRDYDLRARVTTDDEVGYLAGSINAMLEEVTRSSDALRLADRRKDEFLATLAHELRNPLAPLRNGLDILRLMRDRPTPGAQQAIERAEAMMDRQILQISRLVDDLLDVSRISTGKLLLKRETVELKSVVATALETVDALFKMRQHELTVDLPNEPVFVNADPTRLSQVMINLLNNAAKYTAPRGEIRLRAAVAGHELSIDVSDNGVGLDGEAMQRIFDMFHQVDASLDREQAGLGVGLTLARSLVELHGGTISAESAGAGLGSTFQVRLPIVVPSAVKDAA